MKTTDAERQGGETASFDAPPRSAATGTAPPGAGNDRVAHALEETAELLDAQGANPYRVAAYRDAAGVVRSLDRPVADILTAEGAEGLVRLPKIGHSLARTIEHLSRDGTTPLLERLRGQSDPERLLATVPGVGPQLAGRIHERLGVEALADLEAAAWDGRLATVPGMGPRRVRAIREVLGVKFGARRPARGEMRGHEGDPPVSELLGVDEEYRKKAATDRLVRIAPYRFNPTRATWLPILHSARGDRHYTALYSNTARAHALGTTHDWVVIYRDDAGGHGQWTVITAKLGPLHGKRIVRGSEEECARHYGDAMVVTEIGRRLI